MFVMVLWRQACALHNVMAWNSSLMWIMHPIIGQPINRSLCVYMLDVLGFWEGKLCSQSCKVSKQWKKPEALCNVIQCCSCRRLYVCLPWHPTGDCCFLPFHFCFLGSVPSSKFCSSFCAPFQVFGRMQPSFLASSCL